MTKKAISGAVIFAAGIIFGIPLLLLPFHTGTGLERVNCYPPLQMVVHMGQSNLSTSQQQNFEACRPASLTHVYFGSVLLIGGMALGAILLLTDGRTRRPTHAGRTTEGTPRPRRI